MRSAILAILSAAAIASVGCSKTEYISYGEPMTAADSDAIPVAKVVKHADEYTGKTILVSGTVTEVCQERGCWLRLAEKPGEEAIFVKFTCPVEGRLLPLEAVGQTAQVQGELTVVEMSVDEARHYAEDGGATPEEIAKITAPQKRLTMRSPAARVAMPKKSESSASG